MSTSYGTILLYLLLITLLSYSWVYTDISSPNERSRAYLAVALVDHGTIKINKPFQKFGKIMDYSFYKGNKYTDKAPGTGFIAACVYGIARVFTKVNNWSISDILNLFRTFLMIPLGVLFFWLVRKLLATYAFSKMTIDAVSVFISLGSASFHYSTVLLGHHIVSVLFVSVLLLEKTKTNGHTLSATKFFFLGLLAGLAGFVEYQSAIWCVPFACYVLYKNWNLSAAAPFVLGSGIFIALLILYNHFAYDDPFALSYHHLTKDVQGRHSAGIAGVSIPKMSSLLGILFSLHRGLFTTSPFFLLIFPGFYFLFKAGYKDLFILLTVTFVGYLAFISGAKIWHGGWAFGPRLLIPMFGVLSVPVAFGFERAAQKPILMFFSIGLGVCSLLYNQFTHLVFQTFPTNSFNPFLDIVIPAAKKELFSPNLFSHYLGLAGYASVLPAILALAIIVTYIFFYGWVSKPKNKARYFTFLASLLPVAVLASVMILAGPSWKDKKTQKFTRWLNKINKHEVMLIEKKIATKRSGV